MNTTRKILHVDMDAFYASVEQLDNANLRDKPVIVGGSAENRGVVAACSYEARKFGVHSAMPISQAIRKCPHAIVLPVRMNRYIEISKQIHKIFQDYTPDIEPISIDEAFIDVTGSTKLFGPAEKIGRQIKNRIKKEIGLTASVGIAPNKFLAKLASDLEKPDGFVIITEENKLQVIDPLDVSRIWGIGKVAAKQLKNKGITTIRQLRLCPFEILKSVFTNQAQDLRNLAMGIDNRPVISQRQAKSISQEQTFPKDIKDKAFLMKVLHEQIDKVAQRLRSAKLQGKTITLKIRYSNFNTITRSCTIPEPTNTSATLTENAETLFNKWHTNSARKLRLLGFAVSSLTKEGTGQKSLFTDPEKEKQKKLDAVYDKIKQKFGNNALKRGS